MHQSTEKYLKLKGTVIHFFHALIHKCLIPIGSKLSLAFRFKDFLCHKCLVVAGWWWS